MRYRNRGAPFRRDDGSVWERDAVHTPTTNELVRRTYKLRPVLSLDPASGKVSEQGAEEATGEDEVIPGWPLKMQPDVYIRLYPQGDHAELAQQLVDAENKAGRKTTTEAAEALDASEASETPVETGEGDGGTDD